METYLDAMDIWEAVEEDYEIPPLPDNPTMAQIKNHKDKKIRKSKAKAYLFSAVSSLIFTRILSLKSSKDIWDYIKLEYEGDERIKGMQVLNLIRDFEMQKMKETETIKYYFERLLNIANRLRLFGSVFNDSRIVEKILVTVSERFEATITTLENTKDLSKITLAELLIALQAQEQRKVMRDEGNIEGALFAKPQDGGKNKKNKNKKNDESAPTVEVLMTNDKDLFKKLKPTTITKVKIGNSKYIPVQGKRTVAIPIHSGTKTVSKMLYVPEIDQNLLSVG
ncbi:uncharacterized protein LOC107844232 [Capsicum annuum]|uniref:uncharacterized protein LOC107844232 n=1 Tax=Capsicum annuum TaxID=4072 RepID=UPI001FB0DF7E|nr:uncharacterized protein LOC107844232 [Capsicum annuum]